MSTMFESLEELTAEGSIIINKPLAEVWDFITKPERKHQWWDEDGAYIISNWQAGDLVEFQSGDHQNDWRGTITQREEQHSILFDLHSSAEEDAGYTDYVVEVWRISVFAENDKSTKVVIALSDIDADHYSDDAHDHDMTKSIWQDAQKNRIPKMLLALKNELEK
jgi:uncharacterized protein YndB with AHSA1/START domain